MKGLTIDFKIADQKYFILRTQEKWDLYYAGHNENQLIKKNVDSVSEVKELISNHYNKFVSH